MSSEPIRVIRGCDALIAPGDHRTGVDLRIEGHRIRAIVATDPNPTDRDAEIIDGSHLLAVPGLINAHAHSAENALRGAGEGLALEPWLARMFGTSGLFTPDDHYVCALAGAVEMLLTGVTAVLDHLWGTPVTPEAAGAALRAYRDAGIRRAVAPLVADTDFTGELAAHHGIDVEGSLFTDLAGAIPPEEAVTGLDQLLAEWHDADGRRIQVFAGPVGAQWCSDAMLESLADLARRHHAGLTIHLLETRLQDRVARHRFGASAVEGLDRLGVLGPATSLAHAVWVTDEDLELIGERGATVIHNPAANFRLGSGRAPVHKMRARGVSVALGTDGTASSDNQVVWTQVKLASLIHNDFSADRWVGSREAFAMATTGGAQALALDGQLGTLEPGRLADIVLLDRRGDGLAGAQDLWSALALSETGRGVVHVLVAGEPVVYDGRCVRIDQVEARRRLYEQAMRRASARDPIPDHIRAAMKKLEALKQVESGRRPPPGAA